MAPREETDKSTFNAPQAPFQIDEFFAGVRGVRESESTFQAAPREDNGLTSSIAPRAPVGNDNGELKGAPDLFEGMKSTFRGAPREDNGLTSSIAPRAPVGNDKGELKGAPDLFEDMESTFQGAPREDNGSTAIAGRRLQGNAQERGKGHFQHGPKGGDGQVDVQRATSAIPDRRVLRRRKRRQGE